MLDEVRLRTIAALAEQSSSLRFTAYRTRVLEYAVQLRMRALVITHADHYSEYLRAEPNEVEQLLDAMLVGRTDFFREPQQWSFLCYEVLPIIRRERGVSPLRVWSLGCASGQEVYTLAILLSESPATFGREAKIFATDLDKRSLRIALQGRYSAAQVANVPAHLLERYFVADGDGYEVRPLLRRSIFFKRHDMMSEASFGRLDLIVCRNTLIYLNENERDAILLRMHRALRPNGFLFLGSSESLSNRRLFAPLHDESRVYRRQRDRSCA